MSDLKLVTVYQSMGMLGAQVVKAKLEASGIPTMLKYESAGLVFGLTIDGLGMVEVQVPEEYAEDAESIVTEDYEGAPEAEEGAGTDETDKS